MKKSHSATDVCYKYLTKSLYRFQLILTGNRIAILFKILIYMLGFLQSSYLSFYFWMRHVGWLCLYIKWLWGILTFSRWWKVWNWTVSYSTCMHYYMLIELHLIIIVTRKYNYLNNVWSSPFLVTTHASIFTVSRCVLLYYYLMVFISV